MAQRGEEERWELKGKEGARKEIKIKRKVKKKNKKGVVGKSEQKLKLQT